MIDIDEATSIEDALQVLRSLRDYGERTVVPRVNDSAWARTRWAKAEYL